MRAVFQVWLVALMAVAVWLLARAEWQPHAVSPASASPTEFSAVRANDVLARILGPERPHPVGSTENAAVRARILGEFARLGVRAKTYRAFSCLAYERFGFVSCATVTDIIAEVIPGTGKAIVMMAHYDSVPAGPGASDDESGVATVIETVRALKARGRHSLHPVWALITDGEEAGLLGAKAFLDNADLKSHVGAVVNVEARGTSGPSLLFQTSAGDGKLIDLYAKSVTRYDTSSLYAEIYKALPNDTDLTLFIRDGFPAFNFAFVDNVRYYHSPLDTRANLNLGTLQMHGDNLLGVVSSLETTPYAALRGGNDIYVSLFGAVLPRLPASFALPLAIVVAVLLVVAGVMAGAASESAGTMMAAFAAPPALWIGAGLLGWVLSIVAQLVSGHPDPSYAYPWALRLALAFGVWALALIVSRFSTAKALAFAAWIWIAVLGIAVAAFLPGLSPYFLFPGAIAAVLLLVTAREGWTGGWGEAALWIGALATIVLWLPTAADGEYLMGLRLHPLFTMPVAIGLSTALPLLARGPLTPSAWRLNMALSLAAAFIASVVAGLLPAYSARSPQRVNLVYLEPGRGPARMVADTAWKGIGTEPLPKALMTAGHFVYSPDAWRGLHLKSAWEIAGSGYVAPAGRPLYPLPAPQVLATHRMGANQTVVLVLNAQTEGQRMVLSIPREAGLTSLDVKDKHFDFHDAHGGALIVCDGADCLHLAVRMTMAAKPVTLDFAEERFGLPASEAWLQAARPKTAMASQSGDVTVLADSIAVPAR